MGVKNLSLIVSKLKEHGRAPDTPVALIRWGTYSIQETYTGTLDNIVNIAEKENLKPPVIVVVGDVVSLRKNLKWFDIKPLFGKRILITRSRNQISELRKMLKNHYSIIFTITKLYLLEIAVNMIGIGKRFHLYF